jgi:hypothetical protein
MQEQALETRIGGYCDTYDGRFGRVGRGAPGCVVVYGGSSELVGRKDVTVFVYLVRVWQNGYASLLNRRNARITLLDAQSALTRERTVASRAIVGKCILN